MTTAIIGTGGIGSVMARQLASGGQALRLSSAGNEPARRLPARIGRAAVATAGNRDAAQGTGAVVLAPRFTVLKGVIDEIAGPVMASRCGLGCAAAMPGRARTAWSPTAWPCRAAAAALNQVC